MRWKIAQGSSEERTESESQDSDGVNIWTRKNDQVEHFNWAGDNHIEHLNIWTATQKMIKLIDLGESESFICICKEVLDNFDAIFKWYMLHRRSLVQTAIAYKLSNNKIHVVIVSLYVLKLNFNPVPYII